MFTTIICFVFSLKRIQEQLRYVLNLTTNKKKIYRSFLFFKVIFDILEMVEYDIEQVFQETYRRKTRLAFQIQFPSYHSGVRK